MRRRSPLGALGMALVVALGVVAAVAFVATRDDGVSFPDGFAGLTRSTDGQSEAASASFRSASDAGGLDADMAFYAEGGVQLVALAYIRWADEGPGGPDAAFDAFADGLTSGYGGGVLTAEPSERTVGGVEYLCASVTAAVGAGLCVWQDEDTFWMLMDVRPGATIGQTERLAVTAHDAIG